VRQRAPLRAEVPVVAPVDAPGKDSFVHALVGRTRWTRLSTLDTLLVVAPAPFAGSRDKSSFGGSVDHLAPFLDTVQADVVGR
jgi:hypothetical protein